MLGWSSWIAASALCSCFLCHIFMAAKPKVVSWTLLYSLTAMETLVFCTETDVAQRKQEAMRGHHRSNIVFSSFSFATGNPTPQLPDTGQCRIAHQYCISTTESAHFKPFFVLWWFLESTSSRQWQKRKRRLATIHEWYVVSKNEWLTSVIIINADANWVFRYKVTVTASAVEANQINSVKGITLVSLMFSFRFRSLAFTFTLGACLHGNDERDQSA